MRNPKTPIEEGIYRALLPSVLRNNAGILMDDLVSHMNTSEELIRLNDCVKDMRAAADEIERSQARIEALLNANNMEVERRRKAEAEAGQWLKVATGMTIQVGEMKLAERMRKAVDPTTYYHAQGDAALGNAEIADAEADGAP